MHGNTVIMENSEHENAKPAQLFSSINCSVYNQLQPIPSVPSLLPQKKMNPKTPENSSVYTEYAPLSGSWPALLSSLLHSSGIPPQENPPPSTQSLSVFLPSSL